MAGTADIEPLLRRLVERDLGRPATRIDWLTGQLGLRRFARVHLGPGTPETLIARIDTPEDPAGRPAGMPPEPPLEPIRARLEAEGLPVPARYGGDAAEGIDLLEDLGDLSLREVATRAGRPGAARSLHREACALVPRLQRVSAPELAAFSRHLSRPLFAYKADLFAEHALPARGRAPRPAETHVVRSAFDFVARVAESAPQRLAHRDFQSANLHVCEPGMRLVMIDFQGAFLAPPEYDLVCLLRDSYVELPEEEVADHLRWVRPELPDAPAEDEFARRFDLLTLTRKGKDLARFLYAARQRDDRRWLEFVPTTLRALRAAASRAARRDPELRDFAGLVAELPESP